jgi:putative addiction module component (TIGR02574 family)
MEVVMMTLAELGIDQLSVRERLELIEQIWDSLPAQMQPDEVPDWHKELLAERVAESEANPGVGLPWREALAAIRAGRS